MQRKNVKNLTLNLAVENAANKQYLSVPDMHMDVGSASGDMPTVDAEMNSNIEEVLSRMTLTEKQEERMRIWLSQKQRIGKLNDEDFEKLGDLGFGNGGVVMKVRHKPTGIIMARKKAPVRSGKESNQIIKELKILHNCNSPYIVGFYGAFRSEGEISTCMEYMDGLSLDKVLNQVGRIPETILARVTYAVLQALTYLKDVHNVLHRDVKPSNMLINSIGEIKMCDLGVSVQLINSMANSFIGTRSYMSPDRIEGKPYTVQSDVWSLGLSLIELAVGRYPVPSLTRKQYARIFNRTIDEIDMVDPPHASASADESTESPKHMAIFEMLDYIVREPPPALPKNLFCAEFVDFVDKCMRKKRLQRATLAQLNEHPWTVRGNEESAEFLAWVKREIRPRF